MHSASQSSINVKRGAEAYLALNDETFRNKWQALYLQCCWATPFQDYRFIITWYKIYEEYFDPIILSETAPNGNLIGLLAMANRKGSDQLVLAGAHQAEYQVWLSIPEPGTSFIEKALRKLDTMYPGQSLTFRYLPPLTPMDWASKPTGGLHYEIERRRTPLAVLNDSQKAADSFRKKSNRSRLNRLKRLGNVEFEMIETAAALSETFDEIISYYDLRQGALHKSVPFKDDLLKKRFYLALMENRDFLHATLLKVGKETAAAHLGLCDRHKVYLGVFAHSPFLAQHSPGKVHLLMLREKMAENRYSALDLTPGDDPWKERFATDHEEVYIMTVYHSHALAIRHRLQKKMKAIVTHGLRLCGATPHSLRVSSKKLLHTITRNLTQKVGGGRTLQVYTFKREDLAKLAPSEIAMKKNHIPDLLAFQASGETGTGQTRENFLSNSLARLEAGWHVYTCVENGALLYCGWLVPRQLEGILPSIDLRSTYLPGSAGFFTCPTYPKSNDQILHVLCLRQMLQEAAAISGIEQINLHVNDGDKEVEEAIERIGIHYRRATRDCMDLELRYA